MSGATVTTGSLKGLNLSVGHRADIVVKKTVVDLIVLGSVTTCSFITVLIVGV